MPKYHSSALFRAMLFPFALTVGVLASTANCYAYDPPTKTVAPVRSATQIKLMNGTGDAAVGKAKSELCQGCHGENGNSVDSAIPKLNGQFAKYISKQLHDYQSRARIHKIMNAMAATINDDDMADIAAYFAGQSKMQGLGHENKDGENIYLKGTTSRTLIPCIRCHGVQGKGLTPTTALFPVIGGQNKEYLRKQLVDFRDGNRTNSPGGIMNKISQSLTDAEIEALSDYLSNI